MGQRVKRIVSIFVRVTIITLLAASFFDVKVPVKSEKVCRIYAADLSGSVALEPKSKEQVLAFIKWDLTNLEPDDLAAIITFAKEAKVVMPPTPKSDFRLPDTFDIKENDGTNIADA